MIPLQLKIRNFLSYGSHGEVVDFEPHHLICLTGKNGHGKSALLDAITWALWGQARKVAGITRGDEHLIRLGENSMAVTFDFMCNNQRYRVGRDFSIANNKRGTTQLYFGIFKTDIDAYISLTEKHSRDTQEKINGLLGIDYETFTNSIFLRQGQSNEFSKKSPLERKEIISTLLGLSRYENLKQRAIDKQRIYEKEYEVLGHLINNTKNELSSREQIALQLEDIDTRYTHASLLKNEQEKQFHLLKEKHRAASEARSTLSLKLKMIEEQQKILEKKKERIVEYSELRREYFHHRNELSIKHPSLSLEEARAKRADVEKKNSHAQQLKTELLTLAHKKQERLGFITQEIQHARHKKELEINEIGIRYQQTESNRALLEKRITEKSDDITRLQKQQMLLRDEQNYYKKDLEKLPSLEASLQKRVRALDRWKLIQQDDNRKIAEIENEHFLLSSPTTSHCPLCKQDLPSHIHAQLQKDRLKRLTHIKHQCARIEKALSDLKTTIILLTNEQKNISVLREKTLRAEHVYEQQEILIHTLSKELNQLKDEHATLSASANTIAIHHHECIKQLDELIKTHEENILHDPELMALSAQIAQIEQDHALFANHDFERQRGELDSIIEKINAYHHEKQILGIKRNHFIHQRTEILQSISEIRAIKKNNAELEGELSMLKNQATTADAIEKQIKEQEQGLIQLQQKQNILLEQKGAIAQQVQLLEKKSKELALLIEKMANIAQLKDDYLVLAHALGKNGIQAFIIEQAVPELEQEANLLLAKLTNNQAQVMFESLRDLKSGGSKETLDIKISDAMGVRPYELFSGGEAFRIDFAIRIALSKLLARRAGTSLQTLIIDEGFGSQDEEGLALIQEALYMIQDDFEKIIVVSHLPDMKLNFPTNFMVHKNATGSSVTVVQQG